MSLRLFAEQARRWLLQLWALACTTLLVYSPFAQRSLVLMGAGSGSSATAR